MAKVGFGLLGVGKLTSKSLIPAFKFCDQAELVALGTRDGVETKKKIKNIDSDIFFGSYEEVIHHPKVEVVYIVLPNHMHAEWSIKAMKAGKAVLCEKPVSLSFSELNKMKGVAKENDVLFSEAFMYRFHDQHRKVQEILKSQTLGKLQLIKAQFSYPLKDRQNIRLKPECGGGALNDVGCYLLDSLLWHSGRKIIESSIHCVKNGDGLDISTSLQLKLEEGLLAQLFCSTNAPRENSMTFIGEKGSLALPNAYIPASGKQVHLILKTESGQEILKVKGSNNYTRQMDHFSKVFKEKGSFFEGDSLFLRESLHKSLDFFRNKMSII